MSTVREALDMLNETLYPYGFYVAKVPLDGLEYEDLFGGDGNGDAEHHLLSQTYDWRYHEPDKESYTVTLSAKDMRYIGRAMEIYHTVCFERYNKRFEEEIKRVISKMGDVKEV